MSRARWYGRSIAIPFQSVTTAGEDTPMPSTKRPGARAARVAALMASRAGPRVYTLAMAVPSRRSPPGGPLRPPGPAA